MKRAVLLLSIGVLTGCGAAVPPPGWQMGGATLWLPRAAWRVGLTNVDLLQDGHVMVNGSSSFMIDAAGRVMDADGNPVALLRPDGKLIGGKGDDLGVVGPVTAAPPGGRYAWLGILPSGQVVRFDDEGKTQDGGAWVGCGGYPSSLQACMLVTYMVATRFPPPPPPSYWRNGPSTPYSPYSNPYSPGFGFGISPW